MTRLLESTRPAHPRVWWSLVVAAALTLAFGIWAFSQQVGNGFVVTALRNPGYGGAAWGLYIAFDIFFVGVSFAGITVSALARLFNLEVLKPATRVAELVTIVSLIAGGCVIVADLGRPLDGLLKLPRYARPQSPFYGTFTLVVAGYLFSSAVFFFLSARPDAARMARVGSRPLRWFYRLWATGYQATGTERRRHLRASFWLSVAILPLLVTAHSTLGFIFGIQPGRPGWFGALQAPAFVVLAGVSGTAMVILFLIGLRRLFNLYDTLPDATLRWLSNFMATLALLYLYFMAVEELTATYAAPLADRQLAHEVVSGRYSVMFWITVASLLITFAVPFVLRLARKTSILAIGLVAVVASIAAVAKRLLIVVPSQTSGALVPIEKNSYIPNHIEIGVIAGLVGLIVLAVLVFGRLFPLVPTSEKKTGPRLGGEDTVRSHRLRLIATVMTGVAAIAAIAIGLIDSFRLLSGGEIDPRIPYSPVIFAVGVILLFSTAVVYETVPPLRSQPDGEKPDMGNGPDEEE